MGINWAWNGFGFFFWGFLTQFWAICPTGVLIQQNRMRCLISWCMILFSLLFSSSPELLNWYLFSPVSLSDCFMAQWFGKCSFHKSLYFSHLSAPRDNYNTDYYKDKAVNVQMAKTVGAAEKEWYVLNPTSCSESCAGARKHTETFSLHKTSCEVLTVGSSSNVLQAALLRIQSLLQSLSMPSGKGCPLLGQQFEAFSETVKLKETMVGWCAPWGELPSPQGRCCSSLPGTFAVLAFASPEVWPLQQLFLEAIALKTKNLKNLTPAFNKVIQGTKWNICLLIKTDWSCD